MIQFFIRIANGWAGKIIFGALLFGMVFVLGYGGLSSTSRLSDEAIKVGRTKMGMKQLDDLFNKERQRLSGMMGGKFISPKEGIEMGLLDSVVRQETEKMVMDYVKSELGLIASNQAVQKYVENNPVFKDQTGKFDRALFRAYLSQNKMNEQEMALKLQDELATRHLINPLTELAYAPEVLTKILYKYQSERRDVSALLIEADKVKLSHQPTETELKDYYDVYSSDKFMTPEYRSFSYILLTPDLVTDRIKISDEDVDFVFEERKDQYEIPEKRQVAQLFFNDEESAKKAMSGLTVSNFDKKAADLGKTKEEVDFGYVTQNELNEDLSEPVFNAKKGTIIGPIQSANGWHILWVKDIQTAQAESRDSIRQKIRKQLALEKAYDVKEDLVRQLEDSLGMGEKLSDAAKKLNLTVQKAQAVDRTGLQQNGKQIIAELNNQELLQSLFSLSVGESTPFYETDKATIVAELSEVIPVGMKPFENVRDELVHIWQENQQQEELPKVVENVVARIKAGASLQSQGVFSNYKAIHNPELSRMGTKEIPQTAVAEIFEQGKGLDNLKEIKTPNGVMIVLVNDIYYPSKTENKKEENMMKKAIQEIVGAELVGGTVATYANEVGVIVNHDAIKNAFSVYTTVQGE